MAEGGRSHREIERLTGVSRFVIGKMARGRRSTRCARPVAAAVGDDDDDDDLGLCSEPPRRCRGCGAMVYMPCLLCMVRALPARPCID